MTGGLYRIALPAAFLAAVLAKITVVPALPLRFARGFIHELGHALCAWVCSRAATPLPIGFTSVGEERSMRVYFCWCFLASTVAIMGYRRRLYFVAGLGLAFLCAQSYCTFFLTAGKVEQLILFGGVGGEFYLAALFVSAFYYRLPSRLNWDFWRYPFLLVGAFTFYSVFTEWRAISKGSIPFPWGALWGDGEGGDMDRLNGEFGWTNAQLSRVYLRMGVEGLLVIIGHYAYFFTRKPPPETLFENDSH